MGICCEAYALADPAKIGAVVQKAIAHKPDVLVIGGGDGTISSVVDHLVGTGIPLALLPLGTANSFARSLDLPIDLDEAINIIVAGHRRRIDLGMIGNDYFANFAAIGMAPTIATTIPHWLKRWGGRLGYGLWAAYKMIGFRPFRVRIGKGSVRPALWATEVRIANGSFQGGMKLVEQASVESGQIVIQIVEGRSSLGLARDWIARILGFSPGKARLREFRGVELRVVTDPPLPVSIDGEVLAMTPVVASIAPRVIEVFAPPPWQSRAPRDISRAG